VLHPLGFGLAKSAGVDLVFFVFPSRPPQQFNAPNGRSTLIFDHSLQNT
jgi:hypothetical protein